MTVLSAPGWMDTRRAGPVEHWHSAVMHGRVVSTVIVGCDADGTWTARTQLCDRSLHPIGDSWKGRPFATHEAALQAGQAAALGLHKESFDTHQLPEQSRPIMLLEPGGGFQSQALRRMARAQEGAQTTRLPMVVAQHASAVEMIA